MKVILIHDVTGLGVKADVKEVADGFAVNYLIPRGMVKQATNSALTALKIEKDRGEAMKKVHEDLLSKNLSALKSKIISVEEKANDKGHLFAQIHEKEIVTKIKEKTGIDIPVSAVKLEGPIKSIGEHEIKISVAGKETTLKIKVEAK